MQEKLNWTGTIAQAFAHNRSLAMLVIVVTVIVGVLGFVATPKQYNPEIVRPAFIVQVAYDGATTDEAYRLVATELVEKVTALKGVDEVTVQVHDGAMVTAAVIFDVGFPKDEAKVVLQTQLTQHSYLARGGIRYPTVRELNPDEVPILTVRLVSDTQTLSDLRATAVALSHEIPNVPDVAEVAVHGGHPPALVVELLPEAMARAGVSVTQVLAAVGEASGEYPLIELRDGTRRVLVDIENAGTSPDRLREIGITDAVTLGDVARVYRGVREVSSYVRYQEQGSVEGDAVFLSVSKREGASAPAVSQAVRAALDEALDAPDFAGVSYLVVNDDGAMAQSEIVGLMINLAQSILIVGMVLVLFLSPRSALVVGLSIPFTMLIVFALGYLAGQTVNRITLFALILSLGLLVDAAIVVVEAVYAAVRQGVSREDRPRVVVRAVNSVGVGLFLSMLTSVVVFMPMRFISGMMGPYMGPIAFFVPAALVVSFIVAVTVMPYLALTLVHPGERELRVAQYCCTLMDRLTRTYGRVLAWILRERRNQQRILVIAAGAFLVALLIPIVQLVHFQMLPKADRDQYFVQLDMPAGTDVLRTRAVAEALADVALQDVNTRSVQLFVAEPQVIDFNGMFKGAHLRTAPHQATLRVNLVPKGERRDSSTDIVERARAAARNTSELVDAKSVRFIEDPPGPPVRATFVAKVSGKDADERDAVARSLVEVVRAGEGVVDVDSSMDSGYARMNLVVDQPAARSYGVAPSDVYAALTLMSGALEAGQYHDPHAYEYARVEVRIPRESRDAPDDLSTVFVRSASGDLVPLESLVLVTYGRDREPILAEGTVPTRYVTAETEGRSIVYVMLDLLRAIHRDGLAGYSVSEWSLFGMTLAQGDARVRIAWGGEWEMTLENFRDLGLAMGAALFLVYVLLVAQYKNFRTPGLILVTVPLGLVGILTGFMVLDALAGVPLTATALIGFIALIGIVVNNAIILLERLEEAQAEGGTFEEALRDATTSRLRPILLTSLTTVLGSLTIAFDPVWSGLAWAIVFGLSLSTILTLLVFPTLLVYTRK